MGLFDIICEIFRRRHGEQLTGQKISKEKGFEEKPSAYFGQKNDGIIGIPCDMNIGMLESRVINLLHRNPPFIGNHYCGNGDFSGFVCKISRLYAFWLKSCGSVSCLNIMLHKLIYYDEEKMTVAFKSMTGFDLTINSNVLQEDSEHTIENLVTEVVNTLNGGGFITAKMVKPSYLLEQADRRR